MPTDRPPSILDTGDYTSRINLDELREEREKQQRRDERKARHAAQKQAKAQNVARQRASTINAAIAKLLTACAQLDSFFPIDDREFPALLGLRPVLKKLLDEITPPVLPPILNQPDQDEEDALAECE